MLPLPDQWFLKNESDESTDVTAAWSGFSAEDKKIEDKKEDDVTQNQAHSDINFFSAKIFGLRCFRAAFTWTICPQRFFSSFTV